MKKNIISIIGGGAVGTSTLYHLIQNSVIENIREDIEILLFEKSSSLGRGLAYSKDEPTNLLNRSAQTMSAVYGKPHDFMEWLYDNKNYLNNQVPKIVFPSVNKEWYLPRALFGLYLKDMIKHALLLARKIGLKVRIINDEIINVFQMSSGFKLQTQDGQNYTSDFLILAIGHLKSNQFNELAETGRFFCSPYPTGKIASLIPKNASVGILGSRLSALDTAIALENHEHEGKITFISRKGFLPVVKTVFKPHKLKVITKENVLKKIKLNHGHLKLRDIKNMIEQEMSQLLGYSVTFSEWFYRTNNPVNYLEEEIEKSFTQNAIAWQSVLIAMNPTIEFLWHKLGQREKSIFLKRYSSRWLSYRIGMPEINAKKLLKLFKEDKLSLLKSRSKIEYNSQKSQFCILAEENQTHFFDYIIDATGSCIDLRNTKSNLIANLQLNNLASANYFGGFNMDFSSSCLINKNGKRIQNLFAIGRLTTGTYFFTSVLESNVRHAYKISKYISKKISAKSRFRLENFNATESLSANQQINLGGIL